VTLKGLVPDKYTIPQYHSAPPPKEYDDNSYFLLLPDRFGHLTVEGESGTFEVATPMKVPHLFHTKYNWTYSRDSEMDCLFKGFKKDQLWELYFLNKIEFGKYQLHWVIKTGKIRLTENNDTKTSKYLFNIAPFLHKDFKVNSLDDLKFAVSKLLELNEFIPLNLTSPASTTKDLLLGSTNGEFFLFNRISLDKTKFIHSCHVGPRMETRCLGTVEGIDNLDLTKAYLNALARCPSLKNCWVTTGTKFFEEAHPGSGYEIKVKIPPGYGTFPPIPIHGNGHVIYPHGEFVTQVSKPYIDTLLKLGDIPFEILQSVQIIPTEKPTYPFEAFAKTLGDFEDNYQEYFYPINLKFHYSIAGHMLHIHPETDPFTMDITYQASQDYNPANANAIQGMVANEIWELSQITNSEAIRVDAVTGYGLPEKDGFKKGKTGLMTFLTPYLKDKPGSTMYRDLIHRDRDCPSVRISFPMRAGIKTAFCSPAKIGRVKDFATEIPPLGGNRVIDRMNRIGVLEEGRIPTKIPTLKEDLNQYGGAPAWLDDYLRLYPQTRT